MPRQRLLELNEQVFNVATNIKLLGHISWPAGIGDEFIRNYKSGSIKLPQISYEKVDYRELEAELHKIKNSFTPNDPIENFIVDTIHSLMDSIQLNHSIGTPEFTEISKRVFGVPDDNLPNSKISILSAAKQVIDMAEEFNHPYLKEIDETVDAEDVKAYLERRIKGAFKDDAPQVIITEGMAAKATATPKVIRLRNGRHFSNYDFKQLFYHEVMTHSLTSINGEAQPILKLMAKGTLRTLTTQEGLATFAEVITGSMDIHRLKRLALRTVAIEMALCGANFVEVFEYFLSKGIPHAESFSSTQRIFRGGFPDKNIIFTKDCVYLDGLMNIHTLFNWAMKNNRIELTHLLFCGRVSIDDLFVLEPFYKSGIIEAPKFLPAWYGKIDGLAGSLGFSLLANLIRIDNNPHILSKKAS